MNFLEVKDIGKSFGIIHALKNIDLNISQGEITTFLGPSGSGKTTLLRIMAGLESPSYGSIFYKNTQIDDRNKHILRQKSTMVFQKSTFFNTTVFKNVALGLELRGLKKSEIEERVYKVLKKVRMENFAKRMAKKLSGGEQQRVSLARALIIEPELLLLDEPTANLDIANATVIEEIIKDLQEKTTLVIATHNIHQAKRLSNWVTILFEGEIIEQNHPEKVFKNPEDIRTKKFVNGEFYF